MQSLDMLAEEITDSAVEISPGDIGGQYRTHAATTPHGLMSELPLSEAAARSVSDGRLMTCRVLSGGDDRLLAVVGPCSIHDVNAGLAYAKSLGELAADHGLGRHRGRAPRSRGRDPSAPCRDGRGTLSPSSPSAP